MRRLLAAVLLGLAGACAAEALLPAVPPLPTVADASPEAAPDGASAPGDVPVLPDPAPDGPRAEAAPRADGRSAEAGGLRFEPSERDLGRLDAGAAAVVEFPWRRTGPGEVLVLGLDTDCACAVASGLPPVLPEGASGALVLDVKGRSRPGPFEHVVRLRVDRAPEAVLRLRVRGFVGSAVVVEPSVLDLGRVAAGLEVVRAVTVRPPPGVADAQVEAALVGFDGTCEVRAAGRPGVRGADVLVHARVPDRPGPFAGHVEVRVAGQGTWQVPLRGDAVARDAPAVAPPVPPAAGAAPR